MHELPEGVKSTFQYILIAAKRAEQLIAGARARVVSRHVKPTTIAITELETGRVPWRAVTAEEYEQLQQEALTHVVEEEHVVDLLQVKPPIVVPVEEVEAEEELFDELEGGEFAEDLEDLEEPAAGDLLVEPAVDPGVIPEE